MGAKDIGQGATISYLQACIVLNNKFINDITTPLSIPTVQDNVVASPPIPDTAKEYIEFTITRVPGSVKNARGVYEKTGIATARIFTPLGTGYKRYTEIGDAIENAFQDCQWVDRVMSVTDVSVVPIGKSGSFFQTNADITFTYQNNGTN